MLYILRFTNGTCVVALAADEAAARQSALKIPLEDGVEIATVRPLDHFAVQLAPTEDGSLDVVHWDAATLDDVLISEFPLLDQAIRRANAQPFVNPAGTSPAGLGGLQAWYEKNNEIIGEALRQERDRLADPVAAEAVVPEEVSAVAPLKSKSARVGVPSAQR